MKLADILKYTHSHKFLKKKLIIKHLRLSKKDYDELDKLIHKALSMNLLKKMKAGYKLSRRGRNVLSDIILEEKTQQAKEDLPTIGKAKDDVTYIAKKYALPLTFPKDAEDELAGIPETLANESIEGREDLRDEDIVTIDGDDAKDFDDAISVKEKDGGYDVGVHIADVGHFIQRGCALDREARERSNSVYLLDEVIPMFPFPVSNGICSLKEGEDRFTMSVFMHVTKKGELKDYRFAETVIRSKRRLTYRYVQNVLDGKEDAPAWLTRLLRDSDTLMGILKSARIDKGSIDFDFDEVKVTLNDEGHPTHIAPYKRLDSHKIIEELMLLANRCVAAYLGKHTELIYRVHDAPDEEKLANFERIAHNRGYRVTKDKKGAIDYKAFLASIKGKPDEKLLLTLLLRSMKQAYYDTENIGHFGLAFENYTHFTSPIRRYSDLEVHRTLRSLLRKEVKHLSAKQVDEITQTAERCSKQERVAVDAEREIKKLKGARFLEDKVGEEYDGIVTGVTHFGVFIEITEFGVEGLARYADMLDDTYIYNEQEHMVTGRSGKSRYILGDKVRVMVHKVNVRRIFVDFLLLRPEDAGDDASSKEESPPRDTKKPRKTFGMKKKSDTSKNPHARKRSFRGRP